MGLKKLGAALFVVAALGAILASSAFAAATTTDVKWYTGASPGTELAGSAAVGINVSEAEFRTTVSGFPVVLHLGFAECVECKIENSGGVAVGSGKLKFTGVTVVAPSHCGVASTITTKALSFSADWMAVEEEEDFIKFVPASGESAPFASFELTGTECPLSTTIVPKGSVFARNSNPTGTQSHIQYLETGGTVNAIAGGTLHVGTETAELNSISGSLELDVPRAGVLFGTH